MGKILFQMQCNFCVFTILQTITEITQRIKRFYEFVNLHFQIRHTVENVEHFANSVHFADLGNIPKIYKIRRMLQPLQIEQVVTELWRT